MNTMSGMNQGCPMQSGFEGAVVSAVVGVSVEVVVVARVELQSTSSGQVHLYEM